MMAAMICWRHMEDSLDDVSSSFPASCASPKVADNESTAFVMSCSARQFSDDLKSSCDGAMLLALSPRPHITMLPIPMQIRILSLPHISSLLFVESFIPLRTDYLSIEHSETQVKSDFTVTIAIISFDEKVSFGVVALCTGSTRTRRIPPPYIIAFSGWARSA